MAWSSSPRRNGPLQQRRRGRVCQTKGADPREWLRGTVEERALLFKEVAAGPSYSLAPTGICAWWSQSVEVTSTSRRRLQQLIGPGVERYHLARERKTRWCRDPQKDSPVRWWSNSLFSSRGLPHRRTDVAPQSR